MNKYYSRKAPYRWLFLTLFLFSLQSKALTQDSVQISINAVNKPIELVFKQIENQTGYTVFYGKPTLNGDELVTLQTRASLSSVMNAVLKGRGVSWALKDRSIILTKRTVSWNDRNNLDTVPRVNISGSVVDKSGTPISGATISLKGHLMGQVTDNLGRFRFISIPENATLIVSSVGYKPKQIRLAGEAEFRILLDSAITDIQKVEVVSTGYQTIAKERVTGSFFNIDNELFNRRVGTNVLDRIKDLVPGIYTPNNGSSNPLDDIIIRGTSTINASKRPLLVVDNFVYDGDPNSLNPNDVESITILRDAAAASIWGVRAGNGVIVITMKRGKFNTRPVISFNTNFTFGQKPDLFSIPVVPSKDVIALEEKRFDAGFYNQTLSSNVYPVLPQIVEILAKKRAGIISASEADAQISSYKNHDIRNDINKHLIQVAIAQQYSLNISGGGDAYQYYGSIGYDRGRPIDINTTNDRLTVRFNNTWRPIKNLQIRAEMNWVQSNRNRKNSLIEFTRILNSPYQRIVDEQGNALAIPMKYRLSYVDTVKFPGQFDWHYRPLDEAGNASYNARSYTTRINVGVSYSILAGLKAEINYQWQKIINDETVINSLATFSTRDLINKVVTTSGNLPNYPYPVGGVYSRSNSDGKAWNVRGLLSYDKNIGLHDISAILGMEANELSTEAWSMPLQYGYNPQTKTFVLPKVGNWTLRPSQSTEVISNLTGTIRGTLNRFNSYFGNLAYTFNSKYILTASAKIDQSNFFGVKANDRRVPLWSAGIAWQLSQESFYHIDWLPSLRLKATFGYNGNVNAGTSPSATASYFNPSSTLQVPYASISTPPNPQLRWERVKNVNLGIDFGIKNQRVTGNLDFYQKLGIDLISKIDADPTTGFLSYTGNQSSLKIRGIDLSLTSRNFVEKLKWQTTFIISYQNDKVVSYSVKPPNIGVPGNAIIIGRPLSSIYSYKWAGLNPANGDAQLYLNKEIVGSSKLSSAKQSDLVYGGQGNPPFFGSLRNDLSFKNLSLSFSISCQMGHRFRRQSFNGSMGGAMGIDSWQHEDYLNAWKAPGDEVFTNVPGFLDVYSDNRYSVYSSADILLEKGDNIRLQDIRVSYDIDRNLMQKLPFSKISLYMYLNNIGFIWKASKYNPDTRNGLLWATPKTLAFGINVSF